MKKLIAVLTLVTLQLSLAMAAEENTNTMDPEPRFIGLIRQLRWELKATHFDYQEPGVMQSRGTLMGPQITYTHNDGALTLQGQAEYLRGQTNYDGNLSNGEAWNQKDQFRTLNLNGRAMVPTDLSDSFLTSFFAGAGARRTQSGKETAVDYSREIDYYYLAIGPQFQIIDGLKERLLVELEYDLLLTGTVKTYLSEVSKRYPDLSQKLSSGNAMQISVAYMHELGKGEVSLGLSYKIWNVGRSEYTFVPNGGPQGDDAYFFEPESKTALTSISAGYRF